MFKTLKDWACDALGYALFIPAAFVTHVVWSVYGMLAWPLALLGCETTTIKEPYMLVVGPMYVSSRFYKSWMYYGCEPESADDPGRLKIDTTFAPRFWKRKLPWYAENMRGNETKKIEGPYLIERT